MKKDDKCEKTKLGRILEIGKIDEKVPQQRENKIWPNLRTSPQSKNYSLVFAAIF
jgi:hypothetical protein